MTRVASFAFGVVVGGLWVGLAFVVGGELIQRWVRRSREEPVDALAFASRLLILVGSGLPMVPALAAAGTGLSEVESTLRRWRRLGGPAALASSTGTLAPLLVRLGEATASGAAPEGAIRAFIDSERRRRHGLMIERARRLPVRLMVPMTLLVLPGFVLMIYGPTFLGLVTDLVGPLTR